MDIHNADSLGQQTENLQIFCKDMGKITQLRAPDEVKQLEDAIENMLLRLDEYSTLIDLIRSDSRHCIATTLPQIRVKLQQLDQVYENIDHLQRFIENAAKQVDSVETAIDKAEKELGQLTSLKKSFFSRFSTKSVLERRNEPRIKLEFPDIMQTDDWLINEQATVADPESFN